MKAVCFGLTDVGRRRDNNEDAMLVDEPAGLFAVADGMGGHAAGEIASRIAVETLAEVARRGGEGRDARRFEDAARRLEDAVAEANRRICESIEEHEELRGMGTTLVTLLALDDRAVIAHVGDSRAYLLRDGQLRRLTSDHSWVNEQVRRGLLSDDDAQRHPMRNIVTRALGSRSDVSADLAVEPMRGGDVFLLCSDGLNTMLSDAEIQQALLRHRTDPKAACRALVDAANTHGGEDNTTVVVVSVPN